VGISVPVPLNSGGAPLSKSVEKTSSAAAAAARKMIVMATSKREN